MRLSLINLSQIEIVHHNTVPLPRVHSLRVDTNVLNVGNALMQGVLQMRSVFANGSQIGPNGISAPVRNPVRVSVDQEPFVVIDRVAQIVYFGFANLQKVIVVIVQSMEHIPVPILHCDDLGLVPFPHKVSRVYDCAHFERLGQGKNAHAQIIDL